MSATRLEQSSRELYLDLLKQCLTRYLIAEPTYRPINPRTGTVRGKVQRLIQDWFRSRGIELVRVEPFDPQVRADGRDWPWNAETMIGLRRLDNLQYCIADVLRRGIPGDLIETGCWRGGATIFMRAVLKAYGDTQRRVWVADSFQGLPKPDPVRYPADAADRFWMAPELAVTLDEVKANFRRYGLLDDQVCFLVGWFHDTLPKAPIERIAVLRLDGDMYESTHDALINLYPKLSDGGYVIVDDYKAIRACRAAVDDFRHQHGITEPINSVDSTAVFWQLGVRSVEAASPNGSSQGVTLESG